MKSTSDTSTVQSGPSTSARTWRLQPHLPLVQKSCLCCPRARCLAPQQSHQMLRSPLVLRLLLALASVVPLLASMAVPLLASMAVPSLAPDLVIILALVLPVLLTLAPRGLLAVGKACRTTLAAAAINMESRRTTEPSETRRTTGAGTALYNQHLRPQVCLWRPRCSVCPRRRCRLCLRRSSLL